jgi:hypothetical protein
MSPVFKEDHKDVYEVPDRVAYLGQEAVPREYADS